MSCEEFPEREVASESLVGSPERLRIPHDDHRFSHVGQLADGTQFMAFVTGAFPDNRRQLDFQTDGWRREKRWMAVLHLFDAEGNYLSTNVKLGGFDIDPSAGEKARRESNQMLRALKRKHSKYGDIWVKPFTVTLDGVTHSLLYSRIRPEEDCAEIEFVMLEPQDIMFHPPWESGTYST